MGGIEVQCERSKVLLSKFNNLKNSVSNASELLEQELLKYVEQMDFELKE